MEESPMHQRFRKFYTKVLLDNVNKGLTPFLEHVAEQGLVVDLQDSFKRHLYDTACTIATGYNPITTLSVNFLENPFIGDAGEAMLSRHILPGRLLEVATMARDWE
ncbi:hypothetical protein D5086_019941 [Populus alba]|uniref:Uncharacterized protein n=2 Tax=Populus alba TaxID=43335 RepID=A0ACC4BK03_POPAL|nr:hypothetical protein D5086_0000126480 [Populus alba]